MIWAITTPLAVDVVTVATTRHPALDHLAAWARLLGALCPLCGERLTLQDRVEYAAEDRGGRCEVGCRRCEMSLVAEFRP